MDFKFVMFKDSKSYDEFDSQGNKTAQTISKKILEDKIDNSVFEKLLKD